MGRNVTAVGEDKKEGKKELKKHAATIHCSNTLSLLQRKITNALLYHAYNELMLKDEHEITVKQLCRLIGYQGNNHAAIKDAFRELISTIVEWNLINDETGAENWTASTIIASVSLEGPLCYYAYSPRMKQLLHSPSMFGKVDLEIQSRFRSSYGLALYENCIRYRGLPHTKWFEMELFKKLMGVPNGKYDIFRDFKRRVLDKAIEEVNSYSDLVIEADFVKEGRKVTKVRFKLVEREKKTRLGGKKKSTQPLLSTQAEEVKSKLLETFSLSTEQIEELLTAYDSEFVREKMQLVQDSKPFQDGKIKNSAAYLLSAVKNNYQAPKPKAVKPTRSTVIEYLDLPQVKRQVEALYQDYEQYRDSVIQQSIQSLSEKRYQNLLDKFNLLAEDTIKLVLKVQRKKYTRETVMESPQVKALFRRFTLQELGDLSLDTFSTFVAERGEQAQVVLDKLKAYEPDHPLLKE